LAVLVPTILRIDGWRVVVYPNDHPPAHVHVIGPGRGGLWWCGGRPRKLTAEIKTQLQKVFCFFFFKKEALAFLAFTPAAI